MKVLIIEDEHLTADRIRSLLLGLDPDIEVLAILDSVKRSVAWFRSGHRPDLVLMDIQLADGLSFDIFEQVKIDYPVIFLTAYQEYAIKAFKVNSVDYLLKPVTEEDLGRAIEKYRRFYTEKQLLPPIESELINHIRQMIARPYKERFMVRIGEHIRSVEVERASYFYSLQKGTFLHTDDDRNYVIDYTLDALGDLLDPSRFHRINRRYFISRQAIRDVIVISGSKLKILLHHSNDQEIYVSRDRLPAFKEWLDR